MESHELPLVSIVIPVKDEGRFIERCLESIVAQDYPRDRIEVIVVDDSSSDGTRELAGNYAVFSFAAFRLIASTRVGTAAARNIGLDNATGTVIIPLIGHAELAPEYASLAVATLEDRDVDCVGGLVETRGRGVVGRAIALALSSRFGVGNAAFRVGGEGLVDTVAFGAYRREVFDTLGGFLEGEDAGEDDEFNYRLIEDGRAIYLNPSLRATYHARRSLSALAHQYRAYGRAKVAVLAAHPRLVQPRQLAPVALVGGLGAFSLAGVLLRRWRPLRLLLRAYSGFLAVATLAAVRRSPASAALMPGVVATVHISYGVGFLQGLASRMVGGR
ncbi:MAG: glycosyltransferase [Dehalococcoidia bacterium]|nr:glycosyltransferase [Dehalococcoidia bacterium]